MSITQKLFTKSELAIIWLQENREDMVRNDLPCCPFCRNNLYLFPFSDDKNSRMYLECMNHMCDNDQEYDADVVIRSGDDQLEPSYEDQIDVLNELDTDFSRYENICTGEIHDLIKNGERK